MVLAKDNPVVLMNKGSSSTISIKLSLSVGCSSNVQAAEHQPIIFDRKSKGTHGLIRVRKLISDKENWRLPEDQFDWQFPGSSCKGRDQFVLFIEDYQKVYASCPKNVHFLWTDIQLSKGKIITTKLKYRLMEKMYLLYIALHHVMV